MRLFKKRKTLYDFIEFLGEETEKTNVFYNVDRGSLHIDGYISLTRIKKFFEE